MNVLFLAKHLNTGGITSHLYELTRGLTSRDVRVFMATSGGEREEEFRRAGAELSRAALGTKSVLSPRLWRSMGALCRSVRAGRIDCLHAHTRVTQVLGTAVSRRTGVPLVTTCHGYFRPRLFRRMFPCWGRTVIAISSPVERHLREDFRVPAERIRMIRNGIDPADFPPVTPTARQRARADFGVDGQPLIGIIARLSDVKGHDTLIRALPQIRERFPGARLVIAGTGKMEAPLRALVGYLGVGEAVRFIPAINRTAALLPAFDLFVLPSRQEGLGLSAAEAMMCGVPVAASRVGGLPDLISDGVSGRLFSPGDSAELAVTVIELCGDPDRARDMGLAGREQVIGNFSADEMVEQTLEVYREAVNRGGT